GAVRPRDPERHRLRRVDPCLGHVRELDELGMRGQPQLEAGRADSERKKRSRRFDFDPPGDRLPMTVMARPHINFSFLWVVYFVAGGIVSATHHYWQHLNGIKQVASAILAVLLWPLLLIGINLHIH